MLNEFEEDPKDFTLTPMEYVLAALAYAQAEELTLDEVISAASEAETVEQFDKYITAAIDARNTLRALLRGSNAAAV